ncbi:hypothetical protein [Amycolatopsis pigmentata]|uniref:Uncharacterized protein n=1 Tax=Amycolatopsis pigmentata TaxID=450801 RepID=A0ABW5G255_9PSEU
MSDQSRPAHHAGHSVPDQSPPGRFASARPRRRPPRTPEQMLRWIQKIRQWKSRLDAEELETVA